MIRAARAYLISIRTANTSSPIELNTSKGRNQRSAYGSQRWTASLGTKKRLTVPPNEAKRYASYAARKKAPLANFVQSNVTPAIATISGSTGMTGASIDLCSFAKEISCR